MTLIAIAAALAGLLFGYDTGIISGAMLFIKSTFHLSDSLEGIMVSMVPLGALIAAFCCGRLSDIFGRRLILATTGVLYLIGSLLSGLAPEIGILIAGRFLLGLAVGLGSYVAPMYIAEIAKKNNRGALVTLNQLMIVIGIMLSYLVDYIFASHGEWRYMLAAGTVPAIIFLGCLFSLPESPRWLISRGRTDRGREVLEAIHGPKDAQEEFDKIQGIVCQKVLNFRQIIKMGFGRVLALGIVVSIFTQAVGINAIIYYAPVIFKTAGLTHDASSILATVGIGFVNVVFTFIAVFSLDRLGRRKMLLTGVGGIIFSLVVTTVSFWIGVTSVSLAYLVMASFIIFIAFQGIGTGPACWLIPSEIFPTEARGTGMGLSVSFNWLTNFIVALLFPIVLSGLGVVWTFGIFLIIAMIAFLLFYSMVPETKGISLETIEQNIFNGVHLRNLGDVEKAVNISSNELGVDINSNH